MKVDHISLTTTPIRLFNGTNLVSQGTGFYYGRKTEEGEFIFLVTNHHVLTGWPPLEKKPPMGDQITFQFHQSEDDTGKVMTVMLPLFTTNCKPVWAGSAVFPEADLAVILVPGVLAQGCVIHGIAADWSSFEDKAAPHDARNADRLSLWFLRYEERLANLENRIGCERAGY